MKDADVILFGEWLNEPRAYQSSNRLNLGVLKREFLKFSGSESFKENEIFIFVEDLDDEVVEENFIEILEREKKPRFHCHRCKKISVTITYNGVEYIHEFNPASTANKIMQWVSHEADISKNDAMQLILRAQSENGKIFENNTHLGNLVKFPDCNAHLYLTPKDRYQG
jgi:hypothetical protein